MKTRTQVRPKTRSRPIPSRPELIGHWIDGAPDYSGDAFQVFDPSIAEVYAMAAEASKAEVDRAVESAATAYQEKWSRLSTLDRSDLILDIVDRLEPHAQRLAAVESRDTGKPISFVSGVEIAGVLSEFRHYASAIRHVRSSMHQAATTGFGLTLRQPYGVVGLITPFNSPLTVMAEKLGQILAAGNCAVIKPSPLAPASAPLLASLLTEAGLPSGVVNVVQGSGTAAGQALCEHPHVPRISFTGSTRVGQEIFRSGAQSIKKITLELSGKNTCLVFADANLEAACSNALLSSFLFTGQLCTSGSRILVHRSIAAEFTERFVKACADLRIGPASDRATQLGPLISADHMASVQRHIEKGRTDCTVLHAGSVPEGLTGWFEAPHVFKVSEPNHPLMRDEIFGPVSCISSFDSDDEAIAIANNTDYGLASFVWTNDFRRIHRLLNEIETGRIWFNTGHTIPPDMTMAPWKLSGVGEEGGLEGLLSFSRVKTANLNASGGVPSF